MTDAYKCDFCAADPAVTDAYHDGTPALKLYEKKVHDRQGTEYSKVVDLCPKHAESVREAEDA